MKEQQAIDIAARYLKERSISFCEPVRVELQHDNSYEVVFTVPEALDPNCVVDPPDVRVHISLSGSAALVSQM